MAIELISEIVLKNNGIFPLVDTNNIRGGIYSVQTIEERDAIPKTRLKIGMLCYVQKEDLYYKLGADNTWDTANFGSVGIPILDLELLNSLGDKVPSKYIGVPNKQEDLKQTALSREILKSGTYVDILFSALRSLLHEVAKLKNTFASGIVSYTGTQTASSDVITADVEEAEPLWAIDPEDLTEIDSVDINAGSNLTPTSGFTVQEGSISCDQCSYEVPDLSEVESALLCAYTTINPLDSWKLLFTLSNTVIINISKLVSKLKCNIFLLISRTVQNDNELIGNKYIWISITNYKNEVIQQGYYNFENLSLLKLIYKLSSNVYIQSILYTNLELYKSAVYSRELSFTNEDVIPSLPTTNDYSFKAAHITIRSVKSKTVLDSLLNRLLNNELIYVEDDKQLYIKNNYKLIPLSGGGSSDDTGMTQEEVKQWLKQNNYITDNDELNGSNLSPISDITFIHEDSGNKFEFSVDSNGNLVSTKVELIKEDTGNTETNLTYRGAVAYYNLDTKYQTTVATDLSKVSGDSMIVKGDRVRISEWYIPMKDLTQFNCTHDFIELTNCGTDDYPLNNAVLWLLYTKDDKLALDSFNLKGVVKAGSTYTIRGKQHLDLNSPIAYVKVAHYDFELWKNQELYDLTGILAIVLAHKNLNLDVSEETKTKLKEKEASSTYFAEKVHPNLIDVVATDSSVLNSLKQGNANLWVDKAYDNVANSIIKDLYLLDPAKQAFRSLTSKTETSNCRTEAVATEVIPLNEEYISFPHSELTVPVSNYTPRASYENATVCSDKTSLDNNKPNMVVCAFGIDASKTRCFNWVSIGYHDEYIWLRKKGDTIWNRFESYKSGDDALEQSDSYPRKRIFNKTITDCIYSRISGVFPANNLPYTVHKVIIDVVSSAVDLEYEYVVGRSLKNGNFDPDHCSDVYTFTMHTNAWKPRVYQVTDLQGFGWMEYQVWSAAANQIYEQIEKECTSSSKEFPVIINTGDMTLNGTRINEWFDYYNSCLNLNKKYEQMYVIGNNDLANSYSENFLGTGDDNGKSSPYYYNLFYCYEVPSTLFTLKGNWSHLLVYNNKYIPSTYYFYFGNYGYLMVNSELTTVTCNVYYSAPANTNLYTGYNATTKQSDDYSLKKTIEEMIDAMSGKHIIAACHEMPFTVINQAYLKSDTTNAVNAKADRCVQYKTSNNESSGRSLIGSHLNRISADSMWDEEPTNYWFSRLLEDKKITLCIGGHKHTYCCTYPVREYLDGDTAVEGVSTTKQATLRRGTAKGLVLFNLDYFKWNCDPNLKTGVVYFMLQASGYKLKSNKELPAAELIFSKIVPKTKSGVADVSLTYPMYAVISYGTSEYNIDLYRVSGIKQESIKDSSASITEFMETKYSTDKMYSEKLLIAKADSDVSYTNYWLVDSSVTNYNKDKDRCYLEGNLLKSNGATIALTFNDKTHTEKVKYSYEA